MSRQTLRITPDYRRPVADIFIDIATEFFDSSTTLDILGLPRQEPKKCMAGLPFWAPDWSTYHLASSLSCRTIGRTYMFSFDVARVSEVPKHAVVRGTTLELEEHCFDEIEKVGYPADAHLKQDESGHIRATAAASGLNALLSRRIG